MDEGYRKDGECCKEMLGNGHSLQCKLPVKLGCNTARNGEVVTDNMQRTGVAGLFVAGDASIDTHYLSGMCGRRQGCRSDPL